MNRKQRRTAAAQERKSGNEDLAEKMGMFDKLPDACDACEKTFDKKSKSMVQSWNVVVREKEGVVRLYCPNCWDTAVKVIKEVKNE